MNIENTIPYAAIKHLLIIVHKGDGRRKLLKVQENGDKGIYRSSRDGRIELSIQTRGIDQSSESIISGHMLNLLLGDDSELKCSREWDFMANGVPIQINLENNSVEIYSSIVGLPPIYLYSDNQYTLISSDIHLITDLTNIQIYFDAKSICELGYFGHPVDYRTLFRDIEMVKPGTKLCVDAEGKVSTQIGWRYESEDPCVDWEEYIEMQIEAFETSYNAMDLANTFLSLTAGLDTRTIFAAGTRKGNHLAAFTISGQRPTLDCRVAAKLCRNYGNRHSVIALDDSFNKELPGLCYEASKLTGGLASLGQAHEVFFYKRMPTPFFARLSGNLGNQIGRGGTEGISIRNADLSIIDKSILSGIEKTPPHWFRPSELSDNEKFHTFLLEKEIPLSSASNYSIGSHFVLQKSPYANRGLIEAMKRIPHRQNNSAQLSLNQIMLNDLKHRFIGESQHNSFQLRYISDTGGYVASCPINWGANARGRMTTYGIFFGGLSMLDILLSKKSTGSRTIRKISEKLKVAGTHVYLRLPEIMLENLKDFIADVLLSQQVRESHVFDNVALKRKVDTFYRKHGKGATDLLYAMDIALALITFKSRM